MSAAEIKSRFAQIPNATLLDVRTPEEFATGAVEGAVNIPVQELAQRLAEIDRSRPVAVYCRSGGRSETATGILRANGFTAHNVGGIM